MDFLQVIQGNGIEKMEDKRMLTNRSGVDLGSLVSASCVHNPTPSCGALIRFIWGGTTKSHTFWWTRSRVCSWCDSVQLVVVVERHNTVQCSTSKTFLPLLVLHPSTPSPCTVVASHVLKTNNYWVVESKEKHGCIGICTFMDVQAFALKNSMLEKR